jgi:hypothetical protein
MTEYLLLGEERLSRKGFPENRKGTRNGSAGPAGNGGKPN